MSTYYVSPSGSDNNTGTSINAPWKSLGKVNAVTFHAGDNILFQGGQSFYGQLSLNSKDSGSGSAPVTFGSYNGQATIRSGQATGCWFYDASNIWISGLSFVGTPGGSIQSGINFLGYNRNTYYTNDRVTGCNISGYEAAGILVEGAYTTGGYNGLQLTGNVIHDNVDCGIQTCGAGNSGLINFYIAYNQVYNNYGDGHSICTGSGIELGNVSDALVQYNTAYLNGSRGGNGGVGIWAYSSTGLTVQYNESYNNKSMRGMDGDGFDFDLDVSSSVLQYNYAFGNDGTGAQLDQWKSDNGFYNDIVRYNVFQNNGVKNNYGNLEVWGKVLNSYLYNNVIYTGPGQTGVNSAIRVHNSTIAGLYVNGVHFVNNIIDTYGGANLVNIPYSEAIGAKNLTFTGNIYWTNGYTPTFIDGKTTDHSLAAWQSSGQEIWNNQRYGIFANPDFQSSGNSYATPFASPQSLATAAAGYKLQSDSPALWEAVSVNTLYGLQNGSEDFYGHSIGITVPTVAGADQSMDWAN